MDWQLFAARKAALKRPFIVAHRGASAILPENTLPAFERAVSDGADILETDLRFTREGEIVLIHDETVDRTTSGVGRVSDYTLPELKRLTIREAGSARCYHEAPPTLRELIERTKAQMPLALELKDPRFAQPDYAERLLHLLQEYELLSICFVISFDLKRLRTLKALEPSLAIGWITLRNLLPTPAVDFLGPFWPLLLLNPFYAAWARKSGKIVCPLDPAPEPRLGLYLKLGLDVVMTNDPATTLQAVLKRVG